jgi:hypothetical protein
MKRPAVEYARDQFLAREMFASGKPTNAIAEELGLSLRVVQRMVICVRPAKPVVVKPATDEASRRRAWERQKDARQMKENDGKLTFRPGAAARHRRIERLGFDMLPDEFGSGL